MNLYHFTHRPGVKGIVAEKMIRASAAAMPPVGDRLMNFGVHLTTDPRPEGHGLPEGQLITDEQSELLGYHVLDESRNKRALDHTLVRLRLDIPEGDSRLVRFLSIEGMTNEFALGADMAAYVPVPETDDERLKALEKQLLVEFASNLKIRKSPTWYIYKGNAPIDLVKGVAYRMGDGRYHEGTLEEFLEAMEGQWD